MARTEKSNGLGEQSVSSPKRLALAFKRHDCERLEPDRSRIVRARRRGTHQGPRFPLKYSLFLAPSALAERPILSSADQLQHQLFVGNAIA